MQDILNWSEVWALLIPISVVLLGKRQPRTNRPIILYLFLAFALNLFIDLIWIFKWNAIRGHPYNGFLYNIHSIVRFFLFDLYFVCLLFRRGFLFSQVVRVAFVMTVVINFAFFEEFYNLYSPFSTLLLSLESGLLLMLCLQYYLYKSVYDEAYRVGQPDFWIVTGLSTYFVITFFIFLLYQLTAWSAANLAILMWDGNAIAFILFCCMVAKGLYESVRSSNSALYKRNYSGA